MSVPYIYTDADVSEDGRYRYLLTRRWGVTVPALHVIGLNPSTADADRDDPTVRRIVSLARSAGYSAVYLTNLFAFRATSPADMRAQADPVGPRNDMVIANRAVTMDTAVAWGVHGAYRDRGDEVLRLLRGRPLLCWGVTKDGFPRHPLYLLGDTPLVPFESRVAA